MAKVTLISVNDVVYELGIRSLSAYLKAHGHSVQLVFLNEPDVLLSASCLWDVMELSAGSTLIGISLLTHSLQKATTVTRFLHACRPSVPIVWGGIHATGFPDECLDYADMVCLGEGEEALLEIVERVARGQSCNDVRNVCARTSQGEVIKNQVRPFIQNLDSVPFQDCSLDQEYVTKNGRLTRLTAGIFQERALFYSFSGMGRVYVTMTSRGCPFNCTFCCNDVLRKTYRGHGPYVRKRSVGNVVAEIREVLNRHPFYGSVLLEDDSFLFRKTEEIREFAALYAENVHLPFGIEMNPSEVSEEKLRLLQESGLSLVHVGIQSGDAEIRRKYYNRNTSDKAICQTNKILSKLGILHKYDIIVDTPFVGDTQASLRMLRKFKPYFSVNLYSLRVYPGLALEQVMRKAGFDGWLKANDNKVSYNEILSEDPYSFVLKLYRTFPPTRWSRFLARICGSPLLFHLLRRLLASWTCRQLLTRMFGMKPR